MSPDSESPLNDREVWLAEAGRRFAAYRARSGLCVRRLARMSGVSRPTIAALEAGERFPSVRILMLLQGPLGVAGLAGKLLDPRPPSHRATKGEP